MEQQYSMFSKELEEQIARTVITIVNSTAVEAMDKGGKRFYKKKDFCKEMGISNGSLTNWIALGLKIIQIEGIQLVDMRQAEQFLQDHEV